MLVSTPRAAAVGYLNARPLFEPLLESTACELSLARPSEVARQLREGEADLGLVPAIELLRQPDLEILGDAAIACDGAVESVLLLLKRPVAEVQRLAIDAASRTSQVLARVVLEEAHGLHPEVREEEADVAFAGDWADAVLVIGDRALEHRAAGVPHLDLGEAWTALTGQAFVFAVWAGRKGLAAAHPNLIAELAAAREEGLGRRGRMAADWARESGLDEEMLRVYLTHRIRYRLAARERAGLATFLEKAAPRLASMPGS